MEEMEGLVRPGEACHRSWKGALAEANTHKHTHPPHTHTQRWGAGTKKHDTQSSSTAANILIATSTPQQKKYNRDCELRGGKHGEMLKTV